MTDHFVNFFSRLTRKLKEGTLQERSKEIITAYYNKIEHSGSSRYYIENLVRDCLNEIAKSEGDSSLVSSTRNLRNWKSLAPLDYKNLAYDIYEMFNDRYKALQGDKHKKEEAELLP